MIEIEPLGKFWLMKGLRKHLSTSVKWTIDECNDYNLKGTKGYVFLDNTFWYIFLHKTSGTKEDLSFMTISQEGSSEIIFKLDRLPTKQEGKSVRQKLGLRKKREVSPEEYKRLTEMLKKHRQKPSVKG